MKKQILTLSLCLALTATSALASGTKTCAKKAPAKAPVAKTVQTQPQEAVLTPEQAAKKHFEEKMAKEREDLYCKLGLTKDQKDKAADLNAQSRESAKPLFETFHTEKVKLHELKNKKACPIEIAKQKEKVHAARKALKAHFTEERKSFEALLTKDQLAKFKALKEERKQEFKKNKKGCDCKCKCHHHHHGAAEAPAPEGVAPQAAPAPAAGQAPVAPCPCKK